MKEILSFNISQTSYFDHLTEGLLKELPLFGDECLCDVEFGLPFLVILLALLELADVHVGAFNREHGEILALFVTLNHQGLEAALSFHHISYAGNLNLSFALLLIHIGYQLLHLLAVLLLLFVGSCHKALMVGNQFHEDIHLLFKVAYLFLVVGRILLTCLHDLLNAFSFHFHAVEIFICPQQFGLHHFKLMLTLCRDRVLDHYSCEVLLKLFEFLLTTVDHEVEVV